MRVSALPRLASRNGNELVVEWTGPMPSTLLTIVFATCSSSGLDDLPNDRGGSGQQISHLQRAERPANQLARVPEETRSKAGIRIVGVCRKHDWQTAIALTGHSQSWRTTSVDPAYPQQRLAFMAEDTGIQFLLTEEHWAGVLPQYKGTKVCLERDWETIAKEAKAIFRVRGLQIAWLMCSIPPVQPGGQRALWVCSGER